MARTNTRTYRQDRNSSSRDDDRGSSREESRGSSRGGSNYGNRNSSRDRPMMVRIGSLTFTKKMDDRDKEEIRGLLEEVGAQMWLNVYLPKGVSKMNVDNKTKILLSFKTLGNDKIPDFVIGSASLPPDEDSNN